MLKILHKLILFFLTFICIGTLYCAENNIEKVFLNGWNTPVNITNINTEKDDFAPFFNIWTNELIFNSTITGYSFYYTTTFDTLFNFSTATLLNSLLNTKRQNKSYFTLLNKREALISGFNYTENGSYLNIQKTIYQRNTWSEPSKIVEFSDTFFIAQPTISNTGQILIYSTNKNTDGTTDLWYASLQADGSWTMLMPLDEINSIGNEITPYLLNDSVLIFASDGFGGLGGYDLYYSINYEGSWGNPQPLPGINTEFNESDCIILEDGTLIFASDRPGGSGKLDLYYAKMLIPTTKEEVTIPFNILSSAFELTATKNEFYSLDVSGKQNYIDINYSVIPAILEVALELDTINDKKMAVKYAIICDNVKLFEKNNTNITDKIEINLNNIAENIYNCDSLKIEATLTTQGHSTIKNIEINIKKNYEKEQKLYTDEVESYYKIPTCYYENFNDYCNKNSNNLNIINELILIAKKIEIVGNINKNFVNELKKYLNHPLSNITIIKSEGSPHINYLIYR